MPAISAIMAWLPGPPASSRYEITLPAELRPGMYTLALGLFDPKHDGKECPVEFALRTSARDAKGYYRLTEWAVRMQAGS